jgi:hypothetical protein
MIKYTYNFRNESRLLPGFGGFMLFVGIGMILLGLVVGFIAATNPVDPAARPYLEAGSTRRWRKRLFVSTAILIVLGISLMLK